MADRRRGKVSAAPTLPRAVTEDAPDGRKVTEAQTPLELSQINSS
jgi:hypothetical protein